MTRLLLPAPILPPARADLRSAMPTQQTTSPAATDSVEHLSLTVIVEHHAHHSARRFAFHASRQEEPPSDRPSRGAPHSSQALLTAEERNSLAAILDRPDAHDSARFLAGAIAQARPGTALHNPQHREAAIAYRRSDALGDRSTALHVLSDKTI